MTRTGASLKNLTTALIGQAAGVIISFFARMVFLHELGAEYLGINGLFTNILTVLSLVELGVGSAMVYALYKPLSENNTEAVKSLMQLYKKAYRIIGSSVIALGLIFTPFYTVFMNEVPDIPKLTLIYLLYVANTGVSYFYSYKRSLIICDQKRYIATIYRYTAFFIMNAVQIAVLYMTHSYVIFLIIQVIFTWGENVAVSIKADRMFPYLRDKDISPVAKETASDIKKNIQALMLHKVGGVVINSTDSILLSKLVSLTAVGIYNNYYMIISALSTIILQVFSSVSASVGNLNACEERSEKLTRSFFHVFFLNFWIYGFCASCLIGLFSPFITLWLGKDMLFDGLTTLAIVINFYLTGMRRTVLTYREAAGAFYYDRYKPVFESVINIAASVLFARHFGAAGIFIGTITSTMLTCFWIEPLVLFRHVLSGGMKEYWIKYGIYTLASAVSAAACAYITPLIYVDGGILRFILSAAVCVLIPNTLFIILFHRTEEFGYFRSLVLNILKKKTR